MKENYKNSPAQMRLLILKILAGRQLSVDEAETLIRDKKIEGLEGFRSKLGRAFSANLRTNDAQEIEFYTGMRMKAKVGEGADPVDFSTMEPVGKCPKCGSGVFELESPTICEVAAKGETALKCDFRSSASSCGR